MITDEELKQGLERNIEADIVLFGDATGLPDGIVQEMVKAGLKTQEMARELLERREAERQASSWDGAPTWAVSRRPIPQRVKWVYYDAISTEEIKRDRIFLDTLEDRPK